MDSFVTGSHAYGTPRPDSDLDLVVLADYDTIQLLKHKADKIIEDTEESNGGPNSASLRFGKLNLIAVSDPAAFAVWLAGTQELRRRKFTTRKQPVSRDEAVAFFTKLREKLLGQPPANEEE